MSNPSEDSSCFSEVCVRKCGGACCDPWWGIISYTLAGSGLPNLVSLKAEVLKSVKERERRIVENYITRETPPRAIFTAPTAYNVKVTGVRNEGGAIYINLLAMFAFKCRFLSEDGTCLIHPAKIGSDIRPPRCAELGAPTARYGEKGYCRIIESADAVRKGTAAGDAIDRSIRLEKETSAKHLSEGLKTAELAADSVMEEIKKRLPKNLPRITTGPSASTPGRNDPCYCGSGKKYKKCHGQ